jgi:hypothetical protein
MNGLIHWWMQGLNRLLGVVEVWKVGPGWREFVTGSVSLKNISCPGPFLSHSLLPVYLEVKSLLSHTLLPP